MDGQMVLGDLLYFAMTRIFVGTLRSMTRSMQRSWFFWRNLRRAKPCCWQMLVL